MCCTSAATSNDVIRSVRQAPGASLDQACPTHLVPAAQCWASPEHCHTQLGDSAAATLQLILEQLVTLLQADGGKMIVVNSASNTTLIDLACGTCPSACQRWQHYGTAAVTTRPVVTDQALWMSFLAHESLIGTVCICRTAACTTADLQQLSALTTIAANVLMQQQGSLEQEHFYNHILDGWIQALELRDIETCAHTRRVTCLTVALARAWGIGDAELVHIYRGALLHDIGKLAIPDHILYKPGPLTQEEWHVMHQHPQYACEMLATLPFLQPALSIPRHHHEHWDGSGYPAGLAGEQIPLAARLFAVIDVWDAVRSDRPYRAAWTDAQARAHITRMAGSHLDPAVVALFLHQLDVQPEIFAAPTA